MATQDELVNKLCAGEWQFVSPELPFLSCVNEPQCMEVSERFFNVCWTLLYFQDKVLHWTSYQPWCFDKLPRLERQDRVVDGSENRKDSSHKATDWRYEARGLCRLLIYWRPCSDKMVFSIKFQILGREAVRLDNVQSLKANFVVMHCAYPNAWLALHFCNVCRFSFIFVVQNLRRVCWSKMLDLCTLWLVLLLFAAGADIDVVDDEGYAPLHLAMEAAEGPDFNVAKVLLQVSSVSEGEDHVSHEGVKAFGALVPELGPVVLLGFWAVYLARRTSWCNVVPGIPPEMSHQMPAKLPAWWWHLTEWSLVIRPRSHRTRKQIGAQICVQTLWCCLQPLWTLPLTTVCPIICLLGGALRTVWTGP